MHAMQMREGIGDDCFLARIERLTARRLRPGKPRTEMQARGRIMNALSP
jgi:hypothetical protein